MSNQTLSATGRILPDLALMLQDVPGKRRPSAPAAALVFVRLADAHRNHRDYVNESIAQLEAVLPLGQAVIRNSLDAFHTLGLWTRISKGNRHSPTKRTPSFLTGLDSGAYPAAKATMHRGSNPAVEDESTGRSPVSRRDGQPITAGFGGAVGGVSPASPPSTSNYPIVSGASEVEAVVEILVDEEFAAAKDSGTLVRSEFPYKARIRLRLLRELEHQISELAVAHPGASAEALVRLVRSNDPQLRDWSPPEREAG